MIGNREAALAAGALTRIFARFGADPEVRDALLERPALPPGLRAQIAAATAKDLSAAASQWLPRDRAERVACEARDQAICSIASACPEGDRADLARSLRACGALTPALLLRSLLGGDRRLFEGALAELSGFPMSRVTAFGLAPRGEGFAALAHKACLNGQLMPVFVAALAALKTCVGGPGDGLKLPLVETVIDECERRRDPALAKVMALLWRFAAEAVRSEAAGFARDAIAATRRGGLPRSHDFSPANDDIAAEPISGDASGRPRLGPAQLELSAATSDLAGDAAPRVELPLALIAAVHDAA